MGFAVVDLIASANGIEMKKLQHTAAVGQGMVQGKKVRKWQWWKFKIFNFFFKTFKPNAFLKLTMHIHSW